MAKIGFIGMGNMGSAILNGLLRVYKPEDLLFTAAHKEKMEAVSDELIITTDDGSAGQKGFVTDSLKAMLEAGEKIDLVLAIGPVIMMKNVAETTRPYGTPTTASLNTIMVDGTGMCGGCRVRVGDENKFACVDGPEFDAHLVDFANLVQRQQMYKGQEMLEYSCGGHCKCVEE